MARRWWRDHRAVGLAPIAAFAGWDAFTAYLVVQAVAGPTIVWNDSRSYEAVAAHPVGSIGFVDGVRPLLYPLVLKVVGSSTGLEVAQALLASLAWGALAWTVALLVARGWQRVVAAWVVLGLASSLPITLWNRSVLSESLSMSLLALVFTGFIWCARRLTWPRIAGTSVACLSFATTRDAQVWTVALFAVLVAVTAAASIRRSRRLLLRTGVLALCLSLVVGLAEWSTVSSHRTTTDVADVYYVRVFPYPARVAWFAAHGMPDAAQVDALARTAPVPGSQAPVVGIPVTAAFAPLRRWLTADGPGTYVLWLLTHPGYDVTEPLARPERAFNFAVGSLTFYAASTDRLASPLTIVFWPPLLGLVVLSALALLVAVLSGAWRDQVWRAVLALTLVGLLSMVIAWHGDGQEVTRHTVEGFAELRCGLWILFLLGLLDPAASRFEPHHEAAH